MTCSSWRVSTGGQATTRHYKASLDIGSCLEFPNQHYAFSASSSSLLNDVFLSFPITPSAWNILHTDCAGNPRQPPFTGNNHDSQPLPRHVSISSSYFPLFLSYAYWHLSFHGTVSSIARSFLDCCDHITISGLSDKLSALSLERRASFSSMFSFPWILHSPICLSPPQLSIWFLSVPDKLNRWFLYFLFWSSCHSFFLQCISEGL